MKPYGREKIVTQNPNWKLDYHVHKNNRKVPNWWESICKYLKRGAIKHKINKEILKCLKDN